MTTTVTTAPAARPGAARARRDGLLTGGPGRTGGLFVAGAVLFGACVLSFAVGSYPVSPADILPALLSPADNDVDRIVRYVRLPRTVTGLLAGVGLGVAGAVMQGLTRNPLAGPGILGVNAGASFAVVLAMAGIGLTSVGGHLWFAFAGAAVSAVFVHTLGSLGRGGATPVKLALAGAAFTAMIGSLTTAVTLLDAATLEEYRFWAVGSLTRASTGELGTVAPFVILGLGAALTVSRRLNTVALGDDLARSLGTRLVTTRILAAVAVLLLAGAATAVAGPIVFVGLAVPHLARALAGPDYRWILPWCVLLAPTVLLLADVLGRVLVRPEQLQVGIVLGLVGAPFFLHLVRTRKVAQL
ncbi:FecCD family ABC transporter permease [Saccharomonospora iraqiensis]|uniref:FecCD family ABC transporter permease n=1 Tax=Saccharomonospora iraqiensis TaxID=52698 RepID=UPI00022E4CE0|nr:iron ABC transporter permease [Saccharomonospora iraqiensis]